MPKDVIDARSADLLRDSIARFQNYEVMRRSAEADAALLNTALKGKRYTMADGRQYEIERVSSRYDGTMCARGWKVKTDGKLGSQLWDIGLVTLKGFSNLLDDGRPA